MDTSLQTRFHFLILQSWQWECWRGGLCSSRRGHQWSDDTHYGRRLLPLCCQEWGQSIWRTWSQAAVQGRLRRICEKSAKRREVSFLSNLVSWATLFLEQRCFLSNVVAQTHWMAFINRPGNGLVNSLIKAPFDLLAPVGRCTWCLTVTSLSLGSLLEIPGRLFSMKKNLVSNAEVSLVTLCLTTLYVLRY